MADSSGNSAPQSLQHQVFSQGMQMQNMLPAVSVALWSLPMGCLLCLL
jgi:hypothetical protein